MLVHCLLDSRTMKYLANLHVTLGGRAIFHTSFQFQSLCCPDKLAAKSLKHLSLSPSIPPHHHASLLVPSSKWWVRGEAMHLLGIFLLWVPTQVLRKRCSSLLQVLSRGKAGRRQNQIPFYSPVEGREGVCLERGQELLFDESPLHTQSHTGDIPDISSLRPRLQRQV